jgi:hypothetical protein
VPHWKEAGEHAILMELMRSDSRNSEWQHLLGHKNAFPLIQTSHVSEKPYLATKTGFLQFHNSLSRTAPKPYSKESQISRFYSVFGP